MAKSDAPPWRWADRAFYSWVNPYGPIFELLHPTKEQFDEATDFLRENFDSGWYFTKYSNVTKRHTYAADDAWSKTDLTMDYSIKLRCQDHIAAVFKLRFLT